MGKPGNKLRKRRERKFSVHREDPLFQIFERRLYEFEYDSREAFIEGVVQEYIEHLASEESCLMLNGHQEMVNQAVADEVSDMLVRRIYGCLKVEGLERRTELETELFEELDGPVDSDALKRRLLKLASK